MGRQLGGQLRADRGALSSRGTCERTRHPITVAIALGFATTIAATARRICHAQTAKANA